MNKPDVKKLQDPRAVIALTVVGVLVVALGGWFVLVRPLSAKAKDLRAQQAAVQQKIDDQRQQTTAARGAPVIHVADVYRLAKAMPDKPDMPDVLLELSELARDTGITFDSIVPAPAAPLAGYTVLPITVTFTGNFFNLADLLYRLRTLVDVHNSRLDATGRLFAVDTISFAEAGARFPRIQATLVIDAFVYGISAPVSGSTTPAPTDTTATTSTETTSTTTTPTTSTTTADPNASASAAGAP